MLQEKLKINLELERKKDFRESYKRMPIAKAILLTVFPSGIIEDAPQYKDSREATDLIISFPGRERKIDVAVRMRTGTRFENDFTMRSCTINDNREDVELAKILKGYGDLMLTVFLEEEQAKAWHLIKLKVFRQQYTSDKGKEWFNSGESNNAFTSFNLHQFTPDLILARRKSY